MELQPLVEVLSEFAACAAEKLRRQRGKESEVLAFAHTSVALARLVVISVLLKPPSKTGRNTRCVKRNGHISGTCKPE